VLAFCVRKEYHQSDKSTEFLRSSGSGTFSDLQYSTSKCSRLACKGNQSFLSRYLHISLQCHVLYASSEHLEVEYRKSKKCQIPEEDLRVLSFCSDSWNSTSKCSKLVWKVPPLCPARCCGDPCVRHTVLYTVYSTVHTNKNKSVCSWPTGVHISPAAAQLRIVTRPSGLGLKKIGLTLIFKKLLQFVDN
jgi:hypothetical protein